MAAEDFFNRWARRKSETAESPAAPPVTPGSAPSAGASANDRAQEKLEPQPLPTLDDVAQLTPDSDYSRFVAKGVDEKVKRSAMKKLFSDPHFNIMDGLDIYISDYSKPDPIPAAMLAALSHAKSLLDPLAQFEKPIAQLIDQVNTPETTGEPDIVRLAADDEKTDELVCDAEPEALPAPPQQEASAATAPAEQTASAEQTPDAADQRESPA
jgi:hypothetical protein